MYDGLLASIYDYSPYFGKERGNIAEFYLSKIKNISCYKVLELGTATGLLTIPILESGFYVDTVDYSAEMVNLVKEKLNNYHAELLQRVNFIMADITTYTPNGKYGAIVIPDSLLLVLPSSNDFKYVLNVCYNALENGGILLFDIYKPNLTKFENKVYSEVARFKNKHNDVCIVEVQHEIDEQRQLQTSVYSFKKRLKPNKYIYLGSSTIEYRYKYLFQVNSLLVDAGFSNIEVNEIFEGNIFFVSAKKC